MRLHNKVDRRVLKQQMHTLTEPLTTLSFYKYHPIGNPVLFRDHLYGLLAQIKVLGRIYIANEGINAQISVPKKQLEPLQKQLNEITFLQGVHLNFAVDHTKFSFYKLTIKVRHKIVADGLNDASFNPANTGVHLNAEDFNQLTADPNTVIVDMRNYYEAEIGHFKNAILPQGETFKKVLGEMEEKLAGYEDKNIIMYCTGGIRCEKASAYFKHRGFEKVHQLKGGIITYAHQAAQKGLENKFVGKNFVFDERLGECISNEVIAHCHQCGSPCDTYTNCNNVACNLLFIQCDACKAKMQGCCSAECAHINALPQAEQRALRKGKNKGQNIFHKSRDKNKIANLRNNQPPKA